MRAGLAISLVLLLTLGACSRQGAAYAEREWAVCADESFPQQRVEACSAVVDSPTTTPQRRVEALIRRGAMRATVGEQTRAMADFGRALRIDPNNAAAFTERGLVHQTRGAFAQAMADYDTALRLQPGFELAAQRRADAMQGQFDQSIAQLDDLNRAIAANPDNAGLWNNRCWVRAVRGVELEFALADCDRAVTLAPNDANALDSRGLVHFKRGEYAEALADYNAALAIEPRRGHFLYGRGLARANMGDREGAQADFIAAERAEPGVAREYQSYGVTI